MPLTLEEVQHIAELARLQLSSKEMERYRVQLSSILDHVAKLQQLDTTGIAPTSSVLPGRSVLREDVPGESLPREEVLRNTKSQEKGQFCVPPVFGERDG
jgi:aspartyl-tRNA(Asn)/glutamyl-tRNA(Gln) amidotransferase subunit C